VLFRWVEAATPRSGEEDKPDLGIPQCSTKFPIGKSTDVHDIDGHWLARARIDARCANHIAGLHDGLNLRFEYLRAWHMGFWQILHFQSASQHNIVGDGQITLRKSAVEDRLEAFRLADMAVAPALGPATATATARLRGEEAALETLDAERCGLAMVLARVPLASRP
jgi:hypothetical protein